MADSVSDEVVILVHPSVKVDVREGQLEHLRQQLLQVSLCRLV